MKARGDLDHEAAKSAKVGAADGSFAVFVLRDFATLRAFVIQTPFPTTPHFPLLGGLHRHVYDSESAGCTEYARRRDAHSVNPVDSLS